MRIDLFEKLYKYNMLSYVKLFNSMEIKPELKVSWWRCFFTGSNAITLYPVIYLRSEFHINKYLLNHELIHWMQQRKEGLKNFKKIYLIEFLKKWNYKNILYEKEAFLNEHNLDYLSKYNKKILIKHKHDSKSIKSINKRRV